MMSAPAASAQRRPFAKYWAFAAVSARALAAQRAELLARVALYAILITIFSYLWKAALSQPFGHNAGPARALWYLGVTEWIVLSIPLVQLRVQEDVLTGNVAYFIPRPISYFGMRLMEALGELMVRLATLAPPAFLLVWIASGSLPDDLTGLLIAGASGVIGAVIAAIFQTAIGLSAFWIQDVTPVYWIWQKSLFVLGGLLLPLSLYPAWLRGLAEWTPFPAILYRPARLAMDFSAMEALHTLLIQVGWMLVALAVVYALFHRGLRALDINGG